MNFLSFQEYEAITRGLVRGNPSVPVQGTADETKQVVYCKKLWFILDISLTSSLTNYKFLLFHLNNLLATGEIFFFLFNCQLQIWKKYIAWEKNNPLRTEETALLTKRGNTKVIL